MEELETWLEEFHQEKEHWGSAMFTAIESGDQAELDRVNQAHFEWLDSHPMPL